MTAILASFLRDERGAVQLEYAIIAALVGAVTALSLGALGDSMDGMYQPVVHASGGTQAHSLPGAVAP
jgi:Flp pilus assembly pilin Flp